MATDTRAQLLETAENLFAERGFYGVSIAAIADELGLTKQALLHHFGSKEKLYGAVLQRISDDFASQLSEASRTEGAPAQRLKSFMLELAASRAESASRTVLLIRELLDNKRRAETASTWYLSSFLEALTRMVQAVPGKAHLSDAQAFATAYQLLGAINYFAISAPTLEGILGTSRYSDVQAVFQSQLSANIDAILAGPSLA